MAREFPLQTLLNLAQVRTDEAAKRLQALKARWLDAEEKLKQLIAYREGYRARMLESASSGTSAFALRDFQLFMVKLDAAIRLQQEEVARCEARWGAGQQEWLKQRGKVKAFDTLSLRHRRAEARREDRIEQKEQDEFAGKRTRLPGED